MTELVVHIFQRNYPNGDFMSSEEAHDERDENTDNNRRFIDLAGSE